MSTSPQSRRQLVGGIWYERTANGGWAPVEQPVVPTQSPFTPMNKTPVASVPQPSDEKSREQTAPVAPGGEIAPQGAPVPKKRRKKWLAVLLVIVGLVLSAAAAGVWWYQSSLRPVSGSEQNVRVTVEAGSSPAMIGELLYTNDLIRSTTAFDLYTRLSGNRGNLQMGTYTLSPSLSMSEIVEHLTSGKVDSYTITIFSGEALLPPLRQTGNDGKDVQSVLKRAGFTDAQVAAAFAASYDSPLLGKRSSGASLEGYIFPDTYTVDSSMTAEQFIAQTLRTYEVVVQKNDLRAKFAKQGLSLHEGITLASIIEKEMGRFTADMPQVAQVFYTRLAMKMQLGSDVTAYYGADRIGASRAVTVDTPYNTRLHTGMPPGPIGMPSEAALIAAANPASGDYVFFLSGDDGKNYFARTDAEHQKNIANHCQVGCSIP